MFTFIRHLFLRSSHVEVRESPTTLEQAIEVVSTALTIVAITGSLLLLTKISKKLQTIPEDKSKSIGILCGIPAVFAVSALLHQAITSGFVVSIVHTLEGFYEALVVREIVRLLYSDLLERKGKSLSVDPIFPVSIFIHGPIEVNEKKIKRMRALSLQFSRIRPVTALLELFVVDLMHLRIINSLLNLVNKVSFVMALVAMFGMIRVSQGPLKRWIVSQITPIRVVAFVILQTLMISSILTLRLLPHSWFPTTVNIARSIRDLLVISEMALVIVPLAFGISETHVKRVSVAPEVSKKVADETEGKTSIKPRDEQLTQRSVKDFETTGKTVENEVPFAQPVKAG